MNLSGVRPLKERGGGDAREELLKEVPVARQEKATQLSPTMSLNVPGSQSRARRKRRAKRMGMLSHSRFAGGCALTASWSLHRQLLASGTGLSGKKGGCPGARTERLEGKRAPYFMGHSRLPSKGASVAGICLPLDHREGELEGMSQSQPNGP